MSRKLLFASGLIGCFGCELGLTDSDCETPRCPVADRCQDCLLPLFRNPPLENLAQVFLHFLSDSSNSNDTAPTAAKIFAAYDQFLALLDDDDKRACLDGSSDAAGTQAVLEESRQIGHDFRDGLQALFFSTNKHLTDMVMRYGVF